MKSPAYHLRHNKAVDRFRLVEIMKTLKVGGFNFSEYTYFGFGGPFLEDIRLVGNFFPEMETVSIEKDVDVYNRQLFHIPHKKVTVNNVSAKDFIDDYSPLTKSVFWLDYNNLKPSYFDEFKQIIEKVSQKSIVKITLMADLKDHPHERIRNCVPQEVQNQAEADFLTKFNLRFGDLVPPNINNASFRSGRFYLVVEQMLQIAAQQVLPSSAEGLTFQILDSTYYSDTVHMLCVTGMVCSKEDATNACRLLNGCKFSNLNWGNPQKIDVPILSTKERFHLEQHLPLAISTGTSLQDELNYNIDDTEEESIEKLQQYANFAEYLPYFIKAVP